MDIKTSIAEKYRNSRGAKRGKYSPDYTDCEEYRALLQASSNPNLTDTESTAIAKQLTDIQRHGLYRDEHRQSDIDRLQGLPISEAIKESHKLEQDIRAIEHDIDTWDEIHPEYQRKADDIKRQYQARLNGKSAISKAMINTEYKKALDKLSEQEKHEENQLRLQRALLVGKYQVANSRIQLYTDMHKDIIEAETKRAVSDEVRDNLTDLLGYTTTEEG